MTSAKETLEKMKKNYEQITRDLERGMIAYALEHKLHLMLGDSDNGTGRYLIIDEKDSYVVHGDKQVGDWLYSSETC